MGIKFKLYGSNGMGFKNHVIAAQFTCNKKDCKIFGLGTVYQAGMKKDAGRRLKMLSSLERLKTTSKLSFDWSTCLVHICHKQLLDDDYIHTGDICSLVARKHPNGL